MTERLEFDMFLDVTDAVQGLVDENPNLEYNGFLSWDIELWVTGRYRRDMFGITKLYFKFPAGMSIDEIVTILAITLMLWILLSMITTN